MSPLPVEHACLKPALGRQGGDDSKRRFSGIKISHIMASTVAYPSGISGSSGSSSSSNNMPQNWKFTEILPVSPHLPTQIFKAFSFSAPPLATHDAWATPAGLWPLNQAAQVAIASYTLGEEKRNQQELSAASLCISDLVVHIGQSSKTAFNSETSQEGHPIIHASKLGNQSLCIAEPTVPEEIELISAIGQGSFGKVFKGVLVYCKIFGYNVMLDCHP